MTAWASYGSPLRVAFAFIAVLVLSIGCGRMDGVNTDYGQRDSGWTPASINGTSLLAEMYESAGASVSSWGRLSRRLSRTDTIVWFPTEFQAPTSTQLNFLDGWLNGAPNRTLVFVGPGYTATVDYWLAVRQSAVGAEGLELHRRLARARLAERETDWKTAAKSSSVWFDMAGRGSDARRGVPGGPWAEQLPSTPIDLPRSTRITWPVVEEESEPESTAAPNDTSDQSATADQPTATELPVDAEIEPDDDADTESGSTDEEDVELFVDDDETTAEQIIAKAAAAAEAYEAYLGPDPHEVLLSVDGEPFAWRYRPRNWGGSQIIVLTNAAPLLNYSLTRPENQIIARRLVADSLSGDKVIFLETGEGGPPVVESQDLPLSGLAALADWPLGPILVQWLIVGMLFCLAVYPIFGRPRNSAEAQPSDFGAHITALAELLSRTRSVDFARQRVHQFRQQIGREEPKQQPGNPFKVTSTEAKSN
ncbi:MAG: hypothetical protein U0795_21400 [Pirellulales bacterium]